MTDIVERLRAMEPAQSNDWQIAREAANEIMQLRAQMESGSFLTANDKLHLAIERQALEIKERDDEIERLTRRVEQLEFVIADMARRRE